MTTYPTSPLEAIGADGAFEIGGGDFDFGQGYTENLVKKMFEVPLASPGNAIEVLTQQLKKLPLEALQTFKHMIPGTVDDDFIDVATSVATIIGNLASLPKALLSGDFDEWVSTTYNVVSTELKQILEILGGLIVTPINEAVQAVKDWYHKQQTDIQTAIENGAQKLRDQLTGIVNSTPSDVDNWLLGLLTGDSIIPKENIDGFNQALNDAVAQAQQKIRDALTGVVNATPTQLDNWLLNLLTGSSPLNATKLTGTAPTAVIPTLPQNKIQNLAQDIASKLGINDPLDATKLTGTAPSAAIPALGIGKLPDLQSLVDAATNALSGKTLTGQEEAGTGLSDAKVTMSNLFAMLTKVTRDVQALQSENDSTSTGGRRFNIDFSAYPDGAFPSGLFNLTYTGPGTSTLAISNGNAVWNTVNNGYRRATMIFPTPTLTSQQIVRGTLASPPSQGTNVRIWSIARANAAGTDYVFARGYCTGFLTYRGDIGCVVNGVEKVWASNIPLTWSLDMRVICGVGTNPRRHQVLSGNTIVLDIIEPAGAQSVIDANHCYWGAISETDGQRTPGSVAGASVADNAPPAVIGTTFRASRRVTADVTIAANGAKVPNNFYETVDYQSDDLTYAPGTNCRLTATKQGTYQVQYRAFHGPYASNNGGMALLYKNGVPYARGPWACCEVNVGFGVMSTKEDATFASFLVPLNPGDYIEPGFDFTSSMSDTGDSKLSDGSQSYFTVARIGVA
ncbi:minor tail protein [Mycobacterium phage Turbido]|uniref:Minor tail protein n=3 Tax=Turbidovirus turbido TaxID=1993865 RepID=A0A386KMH3_9CAUD|nr:minor tail protein [Mycobacterium phage Turbido]AEL17770.1 minor tail subunit [Mycobacterium phage Turbido]AYD86582.1 minor tail protein [Mycobacterium phage LilTurb]QBI96536.1 minor tail subunit [Mycobacterium phage Whabigail7]